MKHGTYHIVALILVTLTLAGCGEYNELDETAYVFTVSMDKSDTNRLQVGLKIPIPRLIGKIQGAAVGAGGGPGQELYSNTTVNVPTVTEALTMVQLYAGREISLEHVRSIVISEELAREDVEQIIRPLMRNPELRSTAYLFISRGKASRLIFESRPTLEVNTSKFIDLVSRLENVHGLISSTPLGEFYSAIATNGSAAIPLVSLNEKVLAARTADERETAGLAAAPDKAGEEDRKAKQELGKPKEEQGTPPPARTPGSYLPGHLPREGGNPVEFIGLAVFKDWKMVGLLNGNGALAYNLLTGRFASARVTFTDPEQPDSPVSARIYTGRAPEIRVSISDGKPQVKAKLVIDFDLEAIPSGVSLDKKNTQSTLEDLVAAQVKRWVLAAVDETQKLGADIFNFSTHSRKQFRTWNDWRKYDWHKAYQEAKVDVEVFANIRRPGLILGATEHTK